MAETKGPDRVDEMVGALKKWQAIERKSMEQTAEIMETTGNPVIRMIMEIIRQDSMMHHRVQQFIIDSLTREAASLTPEELSEIWTKIEEHDEMEREVKDLLAMELGEEVLRKILFENAKRIFPLEPAI